MSVSLINLFDVAGSAMTAQTIRLNTTASNIANAQSVAADPADTYRARHPVFASALAEQQRLHGGNQSTDTANGVSVLGIVESGAPLQQRYEPDHPFADDRGFVTYPNVSAVEEMANMMSASRAFQLNVEVMNTAKTLAERLLRLGQ
jgi:flagellar basal-body rod protein FlgC